MSPESNSAHAIGNVSTARIIWFFARRHQMFFAGLGILSLAVGVLEGVNLGAFLPVLYTLLDTDVSQNPSRGQVLIVEGMRRVLAVTPVADPFLAACMLLAILTAIKAALALFHEYLAANLTGQLLHKYRRELIRRSSTLPLQSIEESRVGALVHDLIQPPVMLARLLYTLPRLLVDFLRVAFVLALLVYIEPLVSLILALAAGALFLAFPRQLSVYLHQIGLRRRHAELQMNSTASEWLRGIRAIRIAGADSYWLATFEKASREAQSAHIRSYFLLASPRHVFELMGLLLFLAALMLAYSWDQSTFKAHVVVIAVFAVGLVRVLPSLAALVRGPLEIRNAIPDIEQVYRALTTPEIADRPGLVQYQAFRNSISISDVTVEYAGGKVALAGVNLAVPRGSVVALVGRSGSGKTTLLNAVIGIQRAVEGNICFDKQRIDSLDPRSLLDRIGYVGQRVGLFHGSIAQNIAFFRDGVTHQRIERVARLTKVDEFVNSLPDRYATLVEEDGTNLSGGQAQRIAIARALLNEPEILVLDEPTSALDSTSEAYVLDSLQQASKDRTVIIVTHRLSSVRWTDRIYVLDGGRIVADGTWDELAHRTGIFRQMCQEQNLQI